jgi:hypothetical protein
VYDKLEVHEIDFWLQTVEIHIAYCIILVEVVMRRLLARMTCPSDFEILNKPAFNAKSVCGAKNLDTLVSAYRAENSGIWTLWFNQDWTVVSKFVRPPPFVKALSFNLTNTRDVFISKFHELVIVYKGVFNNSDIGLVARDGSEKYHYSTKKVVDNLKTCMIYYKSIRS